MSVNEISLRLEFTSPLTVNAA